MQPDYGSTLVLTQFLYASRRLLLLAEGLQVPLGGNHLNIGCPGADRRNPGSFPNAASSSRVMRSSISAALERLI